jgi:hypothetical protein
MRGVDMVVARAMIHRCPKCEAAFSPPLDNRAECPRCGVWFHKWNVPLSLAPILTVDAIEENPPLAVPDSLTYYGRAAALALVVVWGVFLAAADYRGPPEGFSFMHAILLPIHEAGHVFFRILGEFMTIAGGSLFQILLPFGIGVAFLVKQRDPFGAAICLWWTGASMVDLAPYIWDSLEPQLILLGGHTGEDGPHDWIYILERFGSLRRAHAWGALAHHLGTLVMAAGVAWGASWLWKMAPWRREVTQ